MSHTPSALQTPLSFTSAMDMTRLLQLLRFRKILFYGLAVLSVISIWIVVKGSPNDLAADHRLAPSFAITRGYQLYYPPDAGPVLSTIYGPITAFIYLPATLAHTPRSAILTGTLIALAFFYGSTLLTVWNIVGDSRMRPWEMAGFTIGVVWLIEPLERAASHIHADAPALGFAALSTLFAAREKCIFSEYENCLLAGMCAVFSVFSKQNMAPILLALAVWFAIWHGWKSMMIYVVSVATVTLAVSLITITWFSSAAAFYFNCVYIPLHQSYDKALFFPTLNEMLLASLVLLFIPIGRLFQAWTQPSKSRGLHLSRKTLLLIGIGLLLVPTSILGRMKFGGNENALSPALYFFMLAMLAEVVPDREEDAAAKLLPFPIIAACLIGLSSAAYFAVKSETPTNPEMTAFEYSRKYPGRVYFPQFPLVHLMVEGRLYNFSWGLTDRRMAGYPVSERIFEANVPREAKLAAVTVFVPQYEEDMSRRLGPPIENFSDKSQLPQFDFFELNSETRRKHSERARNSGAVN